MGKKQTAKKRLTEEGFRHPRPAFSGLKRGLTSRRGITYTKNARTLGSRRPGPLLPPAGSSSEPDSDSEFPRSSPAELQSTPACPQPAGRLGKLVLLTSFFTSVRSSSVRDSALGSMEAGNGASSGSGSSGCAALP